VLAVLVWLVMQPATDAETHTAKITAIAIIAFICIRTCYQGSKLYFIIPTRLSQVYKVSMKFQAGQLKCCGESKRR
jgi:hypothetical protein